MGKPFEILLKVNMFYMFSATMEINQTLMPPQDINRAEMELAIESAIMRERDEKHQPQNSRLGLAFFINDEKAKFIREGDSRGENVLPPAEQVLGIDDVHYGADYKVTRRAPS